MRTVLMVLWDGSAYDSLRALLGLAGAELERDGYAVERVLVGRPGWQDDLQRVLARGDVAFAMGMSGVGSDLRGADGRLLWETAAVPFFDWNCDHPCYFPSRHVLRSPFLRHGYVFPDHAAYAVEHLGPGGAAFAVHLGMPRRALFDGAPLPRAERNGRLLFVKSGADPAAAPARWRGLPAPLGGLLADAAEELAVRGGTADVLPTLRRLGEARGVFLDGANPVALSLIRELDAQLRAVRANLVADALRPYPVDVFGSGWDHLDWTGGRAAHAGTMTFDAMVAALPRYLGSVSTNPLVDGSVHDRVMFALAANVVPLSDANAFWRWRLPDLAPYGFGFDREGVAGAVEALLGDPFAALARAEAAYRAALPELTLSASLRTVAGLATLRVG